MKLKKLSYNNFRNLRDAEIEFAPDITVLKGKNAQGKTNVLEGIHVLALTKSFRTAKTLDLIGWNCDFLRVRGIVGKNERNFSDVSRDDDERDNFLEVFYERQPQKRSRFSQNKIPMKAKDYVGQFTAVTFVPDDVLVLTGSPSFRRRYLDVLISQIDREYLYFLTDYGRTIRERNALLARINSGNAEPDELLFWDQKLVEFGIPIMKKRKQAVEYFSAKLPSFLQKIAADTIAVTMKYLPSIPAHISFADYLGGCRESDILYKNTRKGPHRDDFEILSESRNLGYFGSRGEVRSALLALKMCELDFMKEKSGFKPILLLDDVFSELDSLRQNALLELIYNHQTVITTTDRFREKTSLIYDVDRGLLTRV